MSLNETVKPIIALLHLDALPGDPLYEGNMEKVIEHARQDLTNLQNGGVDAVLFTNEFSLPYEGNVSAVTVASLAYIVGCLKREIKIPYGIQVIADNDATIELAGATGADFVRGVFTGAYIGEGGFFSTNVAKNVRRRKELGMEHQKMFYMVNAESDADISGRAIETIIRSILFHCEPDGLCISGLLAGEEADSEALRRIRDMAGGIPVYANTGCNKDNIREKLKQCDGAFIGTGFKKDRNFKNHTDPEAIMAIMKQVVEVRRAEV
jgi:membrane complex biogenesis BtpA family protein